MNIYGADEQMYSFEYLNHYAAFLLAHHVDDYTRESIRLSYEVDLPLLQFLKHLSGEELYQLSKRTNIEFLTYLSSNNAKGQIEMSLTRWLSNQLPAIGKYDVEAKDITITNYLRGKVLKHWMKDFTDNLDHLLKLNSEIDNLILGLNTTFTDVYIQILKERIEEELHFSQNVIDASPGITYIFDLTEGKEVYINGKVHEIMGHTPEEVLKMGSELIMQMTHPDDLPIVAAFINGLMEDREGKTHQAEYRFRDKEGTYHWLRNYSVIYKRDGNGKPTQLLGSSFEISNEKEIASALLKREKQLLEAQAIAQIGSYDWDIVNDISISTPELRKIFESETRQTLEEMMSHVHPDDKEKVSSALAAAFVSGNYACEYRYQAKSGEKIIDSKGIVSFSKEGIPLNMVGTIQDITERKKIEESLIKKSLELEQSNEHLKEFASIASHDLKEPLRKIGLFSNIIISTEWDELSEQTRTNLSKITDAAKRMQQLIEGILSYSSVNGQDVKEHYSLEEVYSEVINNLEYRIKDTDAVITSDGLPEADVIPFQMQQLFQNLISNALKFSKKGERPVISITHALLSTAEGEKRHLFPANTYLQIKVTDNGIGFENDASEKIFGLFQRLHNKSAFEGSGLGLAICKKIVENHGGVITAHSEINAGSTFTITLPYSRNN